MRTSVACDCQCQCGCVAVLSEGMLRQAGEIMMNIFSALCQDDLQLSWGSKLWSLLLIATMSLANYFPSTYIFCTEICILFYWVIP